MIPLSITQTGKRRKNTNSMTQQFGCSMFRQSVTVQASVNQLSCRSIEAAGFPIGTSLNWLSDRGCAKADEKSVQKTSTVG